MLDPQDWGKAGAGRGISAHHATTSGNQPTGQGWGLEYSYDQTHHEKETMAFQSAGLIKTADGKEISFSLNLTMSREFFSRESINLRAGDALIDPLGNDILFGLGEKGIGAIFLGNIEAPFSLKDSSNNLLGQVQKSGLFIREDGTPGTVQQVDMAV